MRSLSLLPRDEARALRGLIFDLDDTVLTHGALSLGAYRALFRLRDTGLRLIACTGRPAGWGEVVARQWPVDAAITENGAVAHRRDGEGLETIDRLDAFARAQRRERLLAIADELRRAFPFLVPTDDDRARVADTTFDIGERERVDPARVEAVMAAAAELGARTFASSIHLHITLEGDDKASGAIHVLRHCFGDDATVARSAYAFVGDSPNDAACFAAFETTFGVANVERHLARLTRPPRYVAPSPMGAGFVEVAEHLVRLRGAGGQGTA